MSQAKGSASRIILDYEDTYKTARSGANRLPVVVPFNTIDLALTRSLNQAQTIRGDRNPTDPFQGNKQVAGSLTGPLDLRSIGYILKAAIGTPTTVEMPIASPTGSDTKTGTPTVTIAAAGAYTFSGAQATSPAGSRVIYEKDGVRYTGYITVRTNETTGTLSTLLTGGSACATVTAATVISICANTANATPGTVAISSGTATFSQAPATLAVGNMIVYDTTQKLAWVTAVADTTHATLLDVNGFAPADTAAVNLHYVGKPSMWQHTFKIHPTNDLPSFTMEKKITLPTPQYFLYTGCKIGTLEIAYGGDGELLYTANILGADEAIGTTAHDNGKTAVDVTGTKFQQFDAVVNEGGTASEVIKTITVNLNNNLDDSSFTIGGGGVRRAAPEGIAGVSGNLNALFEDTTILTKAANNTETSLSVVLTETGGSVLGLYMPEVKIQHKSPSVSGPMGVVLDLTYQGYYANDANASALYAVLKNYQGGY